jgi:outer membrane protein OmpA-like peptidoglycan-associated protein
MLVAHKSSVVVVLQLVATVVALHMSACATPAPKVALLDESFERAQRQKRGVLDALEAKGPLYFESNEDVLTAESRALLTQVAEQMFVYPRAKLVITGHADERGDTAYNLALGERRGQASKAFLVKLGVPAGRLRVVSLGEELPSAEGHDEDSWAMNRRDEFGFIVPGLTHAGISDPDEAQLHLTSKLMD